MQCLLDGLMGKSEREGIVGSLHEPPDATVFRVNTTRISRSECLEKLAQLTEAGSPPPCAHASLEDAVILHNGSRHELPEYDTKLAQVIVDRVCGEAVLKGAHVFAPGVLATSSMLEAGSPVEVWAHCGGSSAPPVRGSAVAEGPPMGCQRLGRGEAAMAKADLFKAKEGVAVHMAETASYRTRT